jgi:protein-tyrosine phosphatase
MRKIRILFVCLGNICRSPLAEAIFKHKIRTRGWESVFEGDSCGTGNYHIGSQPDHRTIANANKNSVPIDHCARQLSENDLEHFDYILAMDSSNLENILRLPNARHHAEKIFLFRDFAGQTKGAEVPDPYFGNEDGFQEVFEILDEAMEYFLDQLAERHPVKA